VFSITRDKSFQISLCLALAVHALVLFQSKPNPLIIQSEISLHNMDSKLKLNLEKRVVKKPVTKKKIVKKAKKAVAKKEPIIEQEVVKAQSAIMKTKINKASMHAPKPRYPRMAIKRGIEGSVVVKILIDEKGLPYDVSVLKSSGHKLLDEAAKKTAMQWKFSPALVDGKPVKSQNHQPFVFSLQNI